jgi:hypothetical protein
VITEPTAVYFDTARGAGELLTWQAADDVRAIVDTVSEETAMEGVRVSGRRMAITCPAADVAGMEQGARLLIRGAWYRVVTPPVAAVPYPTIRVELA